MERQLKYIVSISSTIQDFHFPEISRKRGNPVNSAMLFDNMSIVMNTVNSEVITNGQKHRNVTDFIPLSI